MKKNPRLDHIRKRTSKEVKATIDRSFEIVDRIDSILERQGRSRRDLAILLKKSESEISKWMRGTHNFTIKTIAKLEIALGEKLITVAKSREDVSFVNLSNRESKMVMSIYLYYSTEKLMDSIIFTPKIQSISTKEVLSQFN